MSSKVLVKGVTGSKGVEVCIDRCSRAAPALPQQLRCPRRAYIAAKHRKNLLQLGTQLHLTARYCRIGYVRDACPRQGGCTGSGVLTLWGSCAAAASVALAMALRRWLVTAMLGRRRL